MNALQYNKKQGYDAETIKKIQRTVGASADGTWGKRSVAGIREWQKARGLPADGKCGPGTLAKFEAEWAKDDEPDEEEESLDDRSEADELPVDDDDDDDEVEADATRVGEGFEYFERDTDISAASKGDEVVALLNDLFAFGFTNDPPRIKCGKQGAQLIAEFQRAATTPHRICNYQRCEVPVTFKLENEGVVDAATRAEIKLWKEKGYRWQAPGEDFIERRVRVKKLGGNLPRSSRLLVDVPGTGGKPRKLHRLAAAALKDMVAACKADTGVELLVQSGWRRHRWKSREQYEKVLIQKYGSVKKGKALLGYASAHETGLAVDFGTGGLEARSATIAKQKQTPVYKWLVANAYRFGFCPYKVEPWHWEYPLSGRAWTTGESDWRLRDDVPDDE